MATTAPLTSKDYIGWVQRSLNRVLSKSEVTDGIDDLSYRDLIQKFQKKESLTETREIHPVDQDRLIKLNHADQGYMRWVRDTIRNLGVIELADQQAISAFQKSVGLGSDGWVGAK